MEYREDSRVNFKTWWNIQCDHEQYLSATEWAKLGWNARDRHEDYVLDTHPIIENGEIVYEVNVYLLLDRPNDSCYKSVPITSSGHEPSKENRIPGLNSPGV